MPMQPFVLRLCTLRTMRSVDPTTKKHHNYVVSALCVQEAFLKKPLS